MVLLCWSCGVLQGCSLVFLKVCGEITNSPEARENVFFALMIGSMGGLCAFVNVYCLNLSMKYYSNLDVMPIYQSMILMHMMLSGLILLNESANYSWGQLISLSASAFVIILGIFILTRKQNIVVIKDQEDRIANGESQTYFVSNDMDHALSEVRLSKSPSKLALEENLLPKAIAQVSSDSIDLQDDYFFQLIDNVFDEEVFKTEQ